jgi:electron transfer flavoprotein-quinone oxidoreductase
MAEEKFDVIIVGAGVAGSTAAYQLARQGLEVVLIERGPYPGAKNLSGGVLYGRVLHNLIPEYWQEAPVERSINNQVVSFITPETHFNIDFKSQAFNQPPYNGFTVLRAKFDRWLAEKAEEAGAMLVPGIRVDSVIRREGRVVGITANEEEMFADVVIAADGASSFLAQEAGLRERLPTAHVGVGVKELIGLPREVIEERFNLIENEGVAYNIVGSATGGIAGGGFLYTNLDSLSVGLVIHLEDLIEAKQKPADVFDQFLTHPMIAPLIKGGKLLEYGAHLVPEGGLGMMPQLYTDGMLVVGDAAGFTINNGFAVRGMDLAIGSALAASQAIVEAHLKKDFSVQSLGVYRQKLEESHVMADMRTYARAPQFLKNERLYKAYPEMIAGLMSEIYRQEAVPKQQLLNTLLKGLKESDVSLFDLARDSIKGVRAL